MQKAGVRQRATIAWPSAPLGDGPFARTHASCAGSSGRARSPMKVLVAEGDARRIAEGMPETSELEADEGTRVNFIAPEGRRMCSAVVPTRLHAPCLQRMRPRARPSAATDDLARRPCRCRSAFATGRAICASSDAGCRLRSRTRASGCGREGAAGGAGHRAWRSGGAGFAGIRRELRRTVSASAR